MEIQLSARQLQITPALREYVQQKMDKAQKYFDHIVWGQAFLFIEKRAHKAEMIVHAPGQTFRALSTAADLYSAIDLTSDKIDAQLKKHKERVKVRHKAKSSQTMSEAAPPPAETFSVVRQIVEATSPERAAEEMDVAGRQFLVYLDENADQIHVVFRRSDETIGIIQPVRKKKR
jgi:putative sigma-54 modulation protein